MAKYDEHEWDMKVIDDEIKRHQAAYDKAQVAWAYSTSRSGETTMRKHEVIIRALESYGDSSKVRKAMKDKLDTVRDIVKAELKRIDDGFNDGDLKTILQRIKSVIEREY